MLRSYLLSCLVGSGMAFAALNGMADTVVLTSGEVLEGKILRETKDAVTIQVPFSATIMEDRVVPRSEISRLEKISPDQAAFREVETVVSPITIFDVSDLDPALATVRSFVAKYPDSPHAAAAKTKLNALEAERTAILGGQIKLDGRLLSLDEMQERREEIAGLRLLQDWKQQAEKGDFVGPLNRFIAWEAAGKNNPVFPDAVEQARAQLRSLIASLEHEIRNNPILEKRREEQIALSKSTEQASIRAARERQLSELNAALAAAKKNKDPIPPYAAFSLPSLEAARKAALAQAARLAAMDLTPLRRSLEDTARAREAYAKQEWASAKTLLESALASWPGNSAAQALLQKTEQATQRLEEASARQAEAVNKAAEAAAKDAASAPSTKPAEPTEPPPVTPATP